ncbi:lipopolysaccharide biosynthesis protein [Phaeovulum sp. W22_SRMD_FR3]|uniref:lipopolysaccharide biosynthesis protein n=1 Tax=Phaeovulum sp. W22_SRMD_FR3 TaxID=3240274 RepID=UPI003F9B3E4B
MKSYFGYAPAVLIPRVMSFLIVLTFTRMMAPEEFGKYSLVLVYGELFDTIFLRWIRLGYTRLHEASKDQSNVLMGQVLLVSLPCLLISCLVSLGLTYWSSSIDPEFAMLLILYVVANSSVYLGLQYLRVRNMRVQYALAEALRSVLGFALTYGIVLIWGGHYELLVLGTQSLTFISALVFLTVMVRASRFGRSDRTLLAELLRYSVPLIVSFFLAGFLMAVDRMLLEKTLGVAAVGVYAASYSIARPAIEVLFNIVNIGGFPKLLKAYENHGREAAALVLEQKLVALLFVGVPILVVILTLAQPISDILLPANYADTAPNIMRLVALAAFLRGMKGFVLDQIFLLTRTTTHATLTLIPGLVCVVAGCYLLIPIFEQVGAAMAAMIGALVSLIYSYYLSSKSIDFCIFNRETRIVLLANLGASLLITVAWREFGLVGAGLALLTSAVLYIVVCIKSGVLRKIGG